jgi:sugar phosphate isomerase/epimerase
MEAEEWLDYLSLYNYDGMEVRCEEGGLFAVRWSCPETRPPVHNEFKEEFGEYWVKIGIAYETPSLDMDHESEVRMFLK